MFNIRRSFSSKLSIVLLLLAVPIFTASLGVLFVQSRQIIRKEAVGRASSVLTTTMQRVNRNLVTVETATNANSWLVPSNLHPDSLLAITRRIVQLNPHIDGCSMSTEPYVFPQFGRYFSAYTVREGDSIGTVIEEQYEYFGKVWYKKPYDLRKACWVDYYDEVDSLNLTLDGMIASYSKPIYDDRQQLIGIISTDLSLTRLSKDMSEEKPYPHSYFVMIDDEGTYIVHPDSTRLFAQTIFDGADPREQADIIALGHEMTAGSTGHMNVSINGESCLVCYQPVPGTTWSLAIICPDSDVLAGYHKLTYIIVPLLIIGFLVILLLSRRAVSHAIHPLNLLLEKTQSIAEGNMVVHIPFSDREDAVGRLQNSFARMLQSLNFHMGSVRYTTDQTQRRNEELEKATRLTQEADRQKTAFIQNVSHQIRTPLNIIMGFTQILGDANAVGATASFREELSEEDANRIADTMSHNAQLLFRLVMMLFDSSDSGLTEELNAHKHDIVPCNDVAREAIGFFKKHYPTIPVHFDTELADDFCIETSRLYLMRSLRELFYNSGKYSDGKNATIRIRRTESTVQFIVEDTGKGIAEADRNMIFKFFTKVDDLSEGLGLGLPLAKRHAKNLGGDLTLDASYQDGCRFVFELPIQQVKD